MEVLGIDFGTSNTVAVLFAPGRPPRVLGIDGSGWLASCVFVEDDGTLTVGRDAERKARLAPERFEANPKRRIDEGEMLLGVRVVPVVDAIAAVLRRVAEEARRQLNGRSPDEVHLTHPAEWGSARQNVLLAGARAAGLGHIVSLVPEPVAAAAHFASLPGKSLPVGSSLAVYDLGGGTFDCAVVGSTRQGFIVLAESGLGDVGGVDFDQKMIDHLGRTIAAEDPARWQALARPRTASDRRAARNLREDVRAAKETLSRYAQTDVPMPDPFEDTLLTRREFEALIRPLVDRTVDVLADTVTRSGFRPEQLAGVYLVGGSSRIPLVATAISERLGIVATTLDQPETSVAMGAALVPVQQRPRARTDYLGPPGGAAAGAAALGAAAPGFGVGAGGSPPTTGGQPIGPPTGGPGLPGQVHPAAAMGAPGGPASAGRPPGSGPRPPGPGRGGPGQSLPQGPGSGRQDGQPMPGGPRAAMTGPSAPPPGLAGAPAGTDAKRRRTLQIAVIAAVVVVLAAATTVILLLTRSSGPVADPRTSTSSRTAPSSATSTSSSTSTSTSSSTSTKSTSGTPTSSSGGSSVTTGSTTRGSGATRSSGTAPGSCDSTAQSNGLTGCLSQAAGSLADKECTQDATVLGVEKSVLDAFATVASSWTVCIDKAAGYAGILLQANNATARNTLSTALAENFTATRSGTWKTAKESGRFSAGADEKGRATVLWSTDHEPVVAVLVATSTDKSPDEAVVYWQNALQAKVSG